MTRREFTKCIVAAMAAAHLPAPCGPDPDADPKFYWDAEAFERDHGEKRLFDLVYHDGNGACKYMLRVSEDMRGCLVREWDGLPAGPYIFVEEPAMEPKP